MANMSNVGRANVRLNCSSGPRERTFSQVVDSFPYPSKKTLKLDGEVDSFAQSRHGIKGLKELRKAALGFEAARVLLKQGGEAKVNVNGGLWEGERVHGKDIFTQPQSDQKITFGRNQKVTIESRFNRRSTHQIVARGPDMTLESESVSDIKRPVQWMVDRYGYQ